MALPDLNRQLIRIGTINVHEGPKVNFYRHAGKATAAQMLTAGYFNFGRPYLNPGDRIDAYTEAGNAANSEGLRLKVLTVPAAGNVTVELAESDVAGSQANIADVPTDLANDAAGAAIAAAVNGNATAINAILATLAASGIMLAS